MSEVEKDLTDPPHDSLQDRAVDTVRDLTYKREQFALEANAEIPKTLEAQIEVELDYAEIPQLIDALEKLLHGEKDVRAHIRGYAKKKLTIHSAEARIAADILTPEEHQKAINSNNAREVLDLTDPVTQKKFLRLYVLATLSVIKTADSPLIQRFGMTRAQLKERTGSLATAFLFIDRRADAFIERNPPVGARLKELIQSALRRSNHDLLGHSMMDSYIQDPLGIVGKYDDSHVGFFKPFFEIIQHAPPLVEYKQGQFNPSNFEVILCIVFRQMMQKAIERNPELGNTIHNELHEFIEKLEQTCSEALSQGDTQEDVNSMRKYFLSLYIKYLYLILPKEHSIFQIIHQKYSWALSLNTRFHKAIHHHEGLRWNGKTIPATELVGRYIELVEVYEQTRKQYPAKKSEELNEQVTQARWNVRSSYGNKEDYKIAERSAIPDGIFVRNTHVPETTDPWTRKLFVETALSLALQSGIKTNYQFHESATSEDIIRSFSLLAVHALKERKQLVPDLLEQDPLNLEDVISFQTTEEGQIFYWVKPDVLQENFGDKHINSAYQYANSVALTIAKL